MALIKNQGGQVVGVQINLNAGGAFGGACSVFVDGDHTGQVAGAGVVSNRGNGSYDYQPTAGETAYNHIGFTFVPAGGTASPQTAEVDTIPLSALQAQQAATGLTSIFVQDLLLDAAVEVTAARAGGKLEPGVSAWMLRKLNRLLDRWNATPGAYYSQPFQQFTPTPNHAPHTLGPAVGADWALTSARPDRILGANLVLNTQTPNIRIPIKIRDVYWWQSLPVQRLATSIVTDLYYEPSFPNGLVNLWPVPTSTYPIELRTNLNFAAYGAADTISVPPGYQDALMLSLAEECAAGLGQVVAESLKASASDARVVAFGTTIEHARNARTRDAGMPGGRSGRGYNFRTGRIDRK